MSGEREHCQRIFARLEQERQDTLAELGTWSPARVTFRPSPGAWSAVDVLDHIVRAETATVEDIRCGLQRPHPLGSEHRPGVAALDQALRSEQRFVVPPGTDVILPDGQATLSELDRRWEQTRNALGQLLVELVPGDTSVGVFQHPSAGWMTLPELLEHLSAHLFHHQFQLARLRDRSVDLQA